MAELKTNYVDDVLDSSKNQLRKYQQIQNDDGTVSFVDVTEYSTTGTSFGAKDINDTNTAVNELNNSLDEKLSFTNQKTYKGSVGVINAFSNKEITIDISELGLTRKPIVIPQNTYTGGMGITNITTTSIQLTLFNCYNYAIEFYYGILVLY